MCVRLTSYCVPSRERKASDLERKPLKVERFWILQFLLGVIPESVKRSLFWVGCSAMRMLLGSKAKRSRTEQQLMLELVTANSVQGRLWFWRLSAGWQTLWNLYLLLCNKFLPKMSFDRGKGTNKIHISGQSHQLVNQIAAADQQTSVPWILVSKWRTVISWKMQGCWAVL